MKETRWILAKAFRFCFWHILVFSLILIFDTAITLTITYVNREIVNALAESAILGTLSTLFVGLLIGYMALYFVSRAIGFLNTFGSNFFRLNVQELFHRIFMWKSGQTPQEIFYEPTFWEKYTFVANNTHKIYQYIQNLFSMLFLRIGALVGSIVMFAIYEPFLILYAFLIGAIMFVLNGYISKKEYELDKKQIREQRFHDYYKEVLTGKGNAKELRIYRLRDFFYGKWSAVYEKLRLERLHLALKKTSLNNIQGLVMLGLRALSIGILLVGLYFRRYDLGTFVLLFGLVETCASQLGDLSRVVMGGAYKDTKYLQDYYAFVSPIDNAQIREAQKSELPREVPLPYGPFRELRAEGISFTYPKGDHKAVDNLSFSIRKGEIVSILGYNGSGKTTLSKLLSGSLTPQSGRVTLNDVPVIPETRENIFLYFGVAPQEFPHFILPLRDVVGIGRIEKMRDRQALDLAYEQADLNTFLTDYSKGEETVLGKEYDDEGVDLSGGQWQRLIIASAYMGQPEVLLLDEPTASIDPLKEMDMIRNFRSNLAGRTAILISHRIGFARLADKIIMMDGGRIVEQGCHDELLQKNGIYAKLFQTQKALYEEEGV